MSDNMVQLTIDGVPVEVERGTLIIRAAEQVGIRIPRFCDHPLLKPAGACRQCLVDVAAPDREGNVRAFPKPQASCTMTVMPGMVVNTQRTSETAAKAQRGIMEFLLVNHPLDCPVCDKGGECPLQNQALSNGRETSRFADVKRVYAKPVSLTSQILLDRDRCILCQRCVRFAKQIAGDPFIDLQGRGGGSAPTEHHQHMGEQIGSFDTQVLGFTDPVSNPDGHTLTGLESLSGPTGQSAVIGSTNFGPSTEDELDMSGRPFASYFSGNVIQICPVGALTSKSYRFRSRPFDLVSTPSVTEHDASGSAIRIDVRRGQVTRRLAGEDMDVNEEWITDKDRFAFTWQSQDRRLRHPLVRNEAGELVPTSWADALDRVAQALRSGTSGYLPGGRLTFEDSYAWAKFARVVGRTNDIDQRVRFGSDEELKFLAARVAGTGLGVTYRDLETAGQVLLVGLEPEDECGSIFLRLRKGVLAGSVKVTMVAPFASHGSRKLRAQLVQAAPGTEPEVLAAMDQGNPYAEHADALASGGVILIGERAANIAGTLTAALHLAERTGAKIAWVPRRAGERGGLEAGALPNLLPFGRLVSDPEARADISAAWGTEIPSENGYDAERILAAARAGSINTLLVGGVDVRDFPNPEMARDALDHAGFVVALEVNATEVTERADVVLPVAPPVEKPGTFINWEGRLRPFGQAISSTALDDRQILQRIAQVCGFDLGLSTLKSLYEEVNQLMDWDGKRASGPAVVAAPLPKLQPGQLVLDTHKLMIDDALTLAGATDLQLSARRPVARVSRGTAQALNLKVGEQITISTERGHVTMPVITASMPDKMVWLPQNNGVNVFEKLGEVGSIATVSVMEESK
ncbi:NADH-quinone oxidoreductase subunit G [Boudabousia marimammalium]|uniref:NADH-quinone oxidoreductase subunit G n=1 Tax=Boudabousia marimammalium TaxID=156892 RepID=A0A1Q5PMI3_9ACTO|nr:NADH-quinone oxidoreductase subunit G [Boudabousia marimammalium]OKL48737.1 NADH-quinone oxidoreductase subunit G [Boudabousia marimammalium]